jgi:hypothetical protein
VVFSGQTCSHRHVIYRDQLIAYKFGVTQGVTHPIQSGVFGGISYAYDPAALHPLDGGILQRETAMHIKVSENTKLSTSTVIGALRKLLLDETEKSDLQRYFRKVARGDIPLVVAVNRADLMASLLNLKKEVAPGMKMVFEGAAEAWLIPGEIQEASVGVIVSPPRSLPSTWDERRSMPGLPLSNSSLAAFLSSRGVKVGLGINELWTSVSRSATDSSYSADADYICEDGTQYSARHGVGIHKRQWGIQQGFCFGSRHFEFAGYARIRNVIVVRGWQLGSIRGRSICIAGYCQSCSRRRSRSCGPFLIAKRFACSICQMDKMIHQSRNPSSMADLTMRTTRPETTDAAELKAARSEIRAAEVNNEKSIVIDFSHRVLTQRRSCKIAWNWT